ncbi:MAG: hypothetical protein ACE5HR_04110 [bacterium]
MRGKELSVAFQLSQARVDYIMANPTGFLNVRFNYIPDERCIRVEIYDTRGIFSNKSGIALLEQFKKSLEAIYSFVHLNLDSSVLRDDDIVAMFYAKGGDIPLGYYSESEGKYRPWENIGDSSPFVSSKLDVLGKIEDTKAIKKLDPELVKKTLKALVRREMGMKRQRKRSRQG